jgi:hypothetical protein
VCALRHWRVSPVRAIRRLSLHCRSAGRPHTQRVLSPLPACACGERAGGRLRCPIVTNAAGSHKTAIRLRSFIATAAAVADPCLSASVPTASAATGRTMQPWRTSAHGRAAVQRDSVRGRHRRRRHRPVWPLLPVLRPLRLATPRWRWYKENRIRTLGWRRVEQTTSSVMDGSKIHPTTYRAASLNKSRAQIYLSAGALSWNASYHWHAAWSIIPC